MAFPFSVGGKIKLRKRPNAAGLVRPVTERLQDMLESAQATDWSVEGPNVQFTVSLLRGVWNWNVLVPFDSGRVEVEPQDDSVAVRYQFSTKRSLAITTALVGGIALLVWHGDGNILTALSVGWPLILGAWAWLFGMNYVIAMIRVPLWLAAGLRNVR